MFRRQFLLACALLFAAPVFGQANFEYITAATSGTDTATYTFASTAVGTAHADREVFVLVAVRAQHTSGLGALLVNSVTIGGNTATLVGSTFVQIDESASHRLLLYRIALPTGTTSTIAVNLNRAALRCGIAVYRVVKLDNFTLVDVQTSTSDPPAVTVNKGNGFAIGGATFFVGGGTPSVSWSGLTEDWDTAVETSTGMSAASATTTAASGVTITPTLSGTSRQYTMSLVATYDNYDNPTANVPAAMHHYRQMRR